MKTTTKYTLVGGGIVSLFALGIDALHQYNKIKKNPDIEFDWIEFGAFGLLGFSAGSLTGYCIGNSVEKRKIEEMNFNETKFINNILAENDISNINPKYIKKAEQVKEILAIEYKDKLACKPNFSGSFSDGSIIKNSDIDLSLEFKPKSFSNLKQMRQDVNDKLTVSFPNDKIRTQRKSEALIFKIENKEHKIDIVPGKRINEHSEKVSLFAKPNGFLAKPTRQQTNFNLRNSKTSGKYSESKIIKLLKIWKENNNIPIKSYHLTLLVQKAFNENINSLPHKNVDKLLTTMEFIKNNIDKNIHAPGNTNNRISKTLTDYDKSLIKSNLETFIKKYQKSSLALKDLFE